MNYMFDNFNNLTNLEEPKLFGVSPMIARLTRFDQPHELYTHTNDKYLIPVGTKNHPDSWTGQHSGINIFDRLQPQYQTDLKAGKALLLIDSAHEGYHPKWLFSFFHDSLQERKIPPQSVIYLTGNALVERQYDEWCYEREITERIKCLTYACFEEEIFCNHNHIYTPNMTDHVSYKTKEDVLTFTCLQKRPRKHRREFWDLLCEHDLRDRGLCSFPEANWWIDGEVHDDSNYGQYVSRLHPKYCLRTYVSVVSEPQYYKSELSVFNSEKIFKPIACYHPFIILGGHGSLDALKRRGYRTFSKWFDESYDRIEDDKKRMDAIIDTLKWIDMIPDKNEWFESMKTVLSHNYDRFVKNSMGEDKAIVEVKEYYKEYFNE